MAKYTTEQWAQVDDLLQQGATVSEAADSTGVPRGSIYQRVRKASDPKPGGNRERKQRTVNAAEPITDEKLVGMVTKIAVAPAPVAKLWLHCDYCAVHFSETAQPLAVELVAMSNDYPALRDLLETLHKQWAKAAWGALLVGWLGVPIAHHTLPPDIFQFFALLLGANQDDKDAPSFMRPPHAHTHTNGNNPSDADVDGAIDDMLRDEHNPPPVDNPYDALDVDQLAAMARSAGIRFDMPGMGPEPTADVLQDVEGVRHATAPETAEADTGTEQAPESAASVESDAADQNGTIREA